jgi:outer membrane biogenesis lipoprotein LolB
MVRFQPSILFVVLTVLTGCSAQLERSKEQEPKRVEQKEEQTPSSVPTFRYRPGAGLTIEGPIDISLAAGNPRAPESGR